jgi:DNA-binding XRE family transcriptional regulator
MYIDVKNDDKAESNISNDSENLETKRKLAPSIEKEMSDLFTSQGLKPPENLLKQAKGIKLIKPATHDNKQFFNPLHEKF